MEFLAERERHCRLPLSTATRCSRHPLKPSTICGIGQLSAEITLREFRASVSPRELTAPTGGSPTGSMKMLEKAHEHSQSQSMESEKQNNWRLLKGGASLTGYSKSKAQQQFSRADKGPCQNDRYLHPGTASAGCITVDPASWTKLYQHLILCRRGDGKTVGSVTVLR